MIKLYDQNFEHMFQFDLRSVLFFFFFVSFFFITWLTAEQMGKYLLRQYAFPSLTSQLTWLSLAYMFYGVIVVMVFSALYTIFDQTLFSIVHYEYVGDFFDFDANLGMYFTYLIVIFFMGSRYYFNHYKEAQLRSEQLQKENMRVKFEMLKNQIDPHFFFNSLSVLTSLVYVDADRSAEYITKLSKLYRYILDVRNEVLISMDREMEVLYNYIYLIQIRYQEGVNIQINRNLDSLSDVFIPPGSLQLLFENALKHNSYSKDSPLTISLEVSGNCLVVKNNIQPNELIASSSGIGLDNIRLRYELIGANKLTINHNAHEFEVCLPLITKEKYESVNL
jgi:sensor histidine kinase YesM